MFNSPSSCDWPIVTFSSKSFELPELHIPCISWGSILLICSLSRTKNDKELFFVPFPVLQPNINTSAFIPLITKVFLPLIVYESRPFFTLKHLRLSKV